MLIQEALESYYGAAQFQSPGLGEDTIIAIIKCWGRASKPDDPAGKGRAPASAMEIPAQVVAELTVLTSGELQRDS